MKFVKDTIKSLTKFEWCLWLGSYLTITLTFVLLGNKDYFTLAASLVGATALIFVAKGNVLGQIITVIFSIMYAIISFSFRYYGEMITYLAMTAPIAIASIVTWIKHTVSGKAIEVIVAKLSKKEYALMLLAGIVVTIAFYFILRIFNTNFLLLSTFSVLTSFVASYLTMRRSEFYALAYALNDIVLIGLWIFATIADMRYLPMIICFVVFLLNDIYGFINWSRTKKRQMTTKKTL